MSRPRRDTVHAHFRQRGDFERAAEVLAAEHDRTVEDIIRLTEIAAPSFQETVRAQTLVRHGEGARA